MPPRAWGDPEDRIRIRPAVPADARVAAELICLTMGDQAERLLGAAGPGEARALMAGLFTRRRNRFSHAFADVAARGDQVVGMILGYPERTMRQLQLPMAGEVLRVVGLLRFVQFLRAALPLRRLKEAEAAEYFINTVSVLPGFQGRGIGAALMEHFESRARAAGFRACSLSVEVGNPRARRLYERRGYRVVGTKEVQWAGPAAGGLRLQRMVKAL